MGSKRSINQRVAVKRQLSFQYAVAAGCTLAVVIGTGIFAYLNLNSQDSLASSRHFYAVKSGVWADQTAWEGGVVPPATNIEHNIEILDRVVRKGALNYRRGSGKTLTVKDTLIIEGDLTLGNKSNVTVNEGGVLMIAGNFSVAKNSEITNYGMIAIGGDWKMRSLAKVDYRGDSSRLFHLGKVLADNDPVQFGQTAEDLQQQHAAIYAQVKRSNDALQPIFFTATLQQGEVVTQWKAIPKATYTTVAIEKSTDGMVFNELAVIAGEANSMLSAQSRFVDANPSPGMSYYRLKRVGPDHHLAYSKLIMVANWGGALSENSSAGQ